MKCQTKTYNSYRVRCKNRPTDLISTIRHQLVLPTAQLTFFLQGYADSVRLLATTTQWPTASLYRFLWLIALLFTECYLSE